MVGIAIIALAAGGGASQWFDISKVPVLICTIVSILIVLYTTFHVKSRERFKIRGKIKALTAEGRFQAVALLAMPPAAFALLMLVNRGYALKLLDHPYLILGSIVSMAIGAVWIRRIVNFDF